MRSLIAAGVCTLVLAGAASAQFNDPPALENRNGRLGFQFYMLEVPNTSSMIADAQNSDWGWFDPEYTLTMDEWRDEADRPLPERDDFNITTLMGWKGGSLNRWYVYQEIVDDTLTSRGTTFLLTEGDSHWNNDMIEFSMDPTDHGREFGTGWVMEYYARQGDFSDFNVGYRWIHDNPDNPAAWFENDEIIEFAHRTIPAEAELADLWTTGATVIYEWNYPIYEFMEDGGPSASTPFQMDAAAGFGGQGVGFNLWAEDSDGHPNDAGGWDFNDMTTRGPEASARQYYAHAELLRIGEYTVGSATAVQSSTWGQIKDSFR